MSSEPARYERKRAVEQLLASKNECSPVLHREGTALIRDYEALERAFGQAAMNLATIRPLDMLREGEDAISLGEAAERWADFVRAQVDGLGG